MSNPPFRCPLCGSTDFLVFRMPGRVPEEVIGAACENCGNFVRPQEVRDWSELMRSLPANPLGRIVWRIIPDAMEFAYWVAACKTVGCQEHHPAKLIGEHRGLREYSLPSGIPESFDFQCPSCGKTHRYTIADLFVRTRPVLPPPGFREWW
jgi:transcription elongation factor Elf1